MNAKLQVMNAKLQEHLAFWQSFSLQLAAGKSIVACLDLTEKSVRGTPFETVAASLRSRLNEGQRLSDVMKLHGDVFSPAEQILVRAGEAGGVLDVIARRIIEGLQKGALTVPGLPPDKDPRREAVRLARLFGILLSCGVPILQALDLIAAEAKQEKTREIVETVRRVILHGGTIAGALGEHADTVPEEIRAAVAASEETGDIDLAAHRVADALEANDLSTLAAASKPTAKKTGEDMRVIRLANKILMEAFERRASDIHLDPTERGGQIRLRVDGVLQPMTVVEPNLFPALINRFKIMADMDIAERRLPQDGRVQLKIKERPLDLRMSTMATTYGERMTIRLLDRRAVVLDLPKIGLVEDELETVRRLCHAPQGIAICTGPTGSGKTTLLYAMMNNLDRERQAVFSIEDPIEYLLEGVSQTAINPRIGLTFARAMRSLLRQDPNVIMVTEVRDLETVEVMVQAALTGHLVLTTLHTNDAPAAVTRLMDIGVEPFLVNSSLAGVIAQRLVRCLCPKCKQPAPPNLALQPPDAAAFIKRHKNATFCAAMGCDDCKGTGYRGRTAIHEILIPDGAFQQAVAAREPLANLRAAAVAAGMKPMFLCGLEKAARGITSIEEVIRVAPRGAEGR